MLRLFFDSDCDVDIKTAKEYGAELISMPYTVDGKLICPYEDYEEFLESRCFPRERDKIKIELKRLGIPFYDPMMIIEKTEGRMAEDDFWIKIVRD